MSKEAKSQDTSALVFTKWVQDKRIVIADCSNSSRANISSSLTKMGAKISNIRLCANFTDAKHAVETHKPQLVVADYDLGKSCGLDLFQTLRELDPIQAKSTVFILVTGNTSQTAVAKAAEEDCDTFIIKPFTADSIRSSIMKAVVSKVAPSEYMQRINKGKELLEKSSYEEAEKEFAAAKKLNNSPSLACFYTGQTELLKKLLDDARGEFEEGLGYNKIHFKCLVGMFDILMGQKKYNTAYEVIKKISQYFPANPKRLTTVLRLAIMTQSYADVERYYQLFTNIETRNDEMVRYVCAALIVCGKYYLQNSASTRAIELFTKAAATATDKGKILKEVIFSLIENRMTEEAKKFLNKFPPELQKGYDYLTSKLLVDDTAENAAGLTIKNGKQLIQLGIKEPRIYLTLIRRSVQIRQSNEAQSFVQAAQKIWPEQSASFEDALKKAVEEIATKDGSNKKAA